MLKGSLVALVTPFDESGEVNYEKLKELILYHLEHQTDGFVILGTTGEATTLTLEEKKRIVEFTVKLVHHQIPVIVGAGSNNTSEAIRLVECFSAMGVDYVLTITPYYNKTNTNGLIKHFELLADHSTCPIILYNVPSRTGMSVSIEALEVLSKHPNIAGIKEASGNMSYAVKISKLLDDNFVMLSGNDDIIVPMMSVGAKGVISVLANICPLQVSKMCRLANSNDFASARKIQNQLLSVANSLFLETNPIPVKAAMNYLGFGVGGYRMPLAQMDDALYLKMVEIIKSHKEWIY